MMKAMLFASILAVTIPVGLFSPTPLDSLTMNLNINDSPQGQGNYGGKGYEGYYGGNGDEGYYGGKGYKGYNGGKGYEGYYGGKGDEGYYGGKGYEGYYGGYYGEKGYGGYYEGREAQDGAICDVETPCEDGTYCCYHGDEKPGHCLPLGSGPGSICTSPTIRK